MRSGLHPVCPSLQLLRAAQFWVCSLTRKRVALQGQTSRHPDTFYDLDDAIVATWPRRRGRLSAMEKGHENRFHDPHHPYVPSEQGTYFRAGLGSNGFAGNTRRQGRIFYLAAWRKLSRMGASGIIHSGQQRICLGSCDDDSSTTLSPTSIEE